MNRSKRYSTEVRQRAVRMVLDHKHDKGRRGGSFSGDPDRIKELERENRELRRANEVMPAGIHQVTWDGTHVASGVYIYRLTAGNVEVTRQMMLLK
ncbi:hypothetical protein QLX67_00210 [Balneolaceae bacterium ANBcel3]|nr:hypothetical protein [Balneolaceae bacterium ANBcel3]